MSAFSRSFCAILIAPLLSVLALQAQMSMPMQMPMPAGTQMDPSAPKPTEDSMKMNMGGPAANLRENILRHTSSGTSLDPGSVSPPMLMQMRRNWMLMLHGQASVVEQQQTGPRGHDKAFSVNWIMPMAQRNFRSGKFGSGELTLRVMLSLEPATISGRYFPELFQQGETAFGKPIVDGQHPHNLFMEIAALYDLKLAKQSVISFYAAPVGDPALGPVAYPHRASASENPLAPLGHHLEDSTHIADEVATVGLAVSKIRLEASGFYGREPDENRWHIEIGGVDSWSARLTVAPSKNWVAQYSLGHLHSPEALHPEGDVLRQTASIGWHRRWQTNSIDALALFGRNHSIGGAEDSNGYLFEGTAHLGKGSDAPNALWTRIENVDRTTDLLGPKAPQEELVIGRVQAYSSGYAHRIFHSQWNTASLGAQATFYNTPAPLRTQYGDLPIGVAAVLKIQLGK